MKQVVDIKNWIKFISFILVIFILIFFVFQTDWYEMIKKGDFDSILKQNIWFILAITLLLMVIQNTFTIIPLILVITVNYVLFGFLYGFLWSWITSLIGSAIIFVAARYFFQSWTKKKVDPTLLNKLEQKGFSFIFQARIIPFIPTSLINIIGGISSIKFKSFMIATSIGNFFYFFVMILIPAGLLNISLNKYLIEGTLLLVLIIVFIIRRKRKKVHHPLEEE